MADFLPTGKPAKPKLASLAKAFHGSCACGRGGGNGTHRAPPGHRGRVAGVACLKWQRTHVRPDQRQRAQCCSACANLLRWWTRRTLRRYVGGRGKRLRTVMDDGGGKLSCCSSSWFILSSSIGTCANHLASQCAARRSGRAVLLRKDALRSSKIRPDRRVCGCGSARAGAHPARGPRGLRPPRCLANRDPSRRSQRSGCSRRTADVGLAGLAVHEGVDRVHRHAPVSLWRLVAITLWSRCSWLRAARPWNGAKKTGVVVAAPFRRRRRRRRQTCETVGRIRQVVVTAF